MTSAQELLDVLVEQMTDVETGWSIGTFGAIAEFSRDVGEATEIDLGDGAASAVTGRGGLRIGVSGSLRVIAAETLTRLSWSQRVALCLPEQGCAMNRRTVLTEIGPDEEALRPQDRTAILFDLGLGALQVDACVRSDDPDVAAALRTWQGRSLFDPDCRAMATILATSPHRVFLSRLGRIEVFQPIPPPNGKSPQGPHTHVLPKLLRHRRTHAATELVPEGWVPCAHFYPPHPARDDEGNSRPFESRRYTAFQALLDRYGEQDLLAIKRSVVTAVKAGREPSAIAAPDRFARATVRVALRQLQALQPTLPALAVWRSAHDHSDPDALDDSLGEHPCMA